MCKDCTFMVTRSTKEGRTTGPPVGVMGGGNVVGKINVFQRRTLIGKVPLRSAGIGIPKGYSGKVPDGSAIEIGFPNANWYGFIIRGSAEVTGSRVRNRAEALS